MGIVRAIAAVIVGSLTAAIVIVGVSLGLLFGLGTEKIYAPGSFMVEDWYCYAGLGVMLVSGVLGGLVCALIARSTMPVIALAGLFLICGELIAFGNMSKPDPGPRVGEVKLAELMDKAKQPNWYAFFVPFLGAGGVIIGGSLRKTAARSLP